jgi:hypothetical protein
LRCDHIPVLVTVPSIWECMGRPGLWQQRCHFGHRWSHCTHQRCESVTVYFHRFSDRSKPGCNQITELHAFCQVHVRGHTLRWRQPNLRERPGVFWCLPPVQPFSRKASPVQLPGSNCENCVKRGRSGRHSHQLQHGRLGGVSLLGRTSTQLHTRIRFVGAQHQGIPRRRSGD